MNRKILSIDWDYFIDASLDERSLYFPDGGNEELSMHIQNIIWVSRYMKIKDRKSLIDFEVRKKDITTLQHILLDNSEAITLIADSHKHIYEFIHELREKYGWGKIDITNIDYHHDLFDIGEGINCGNWFNHLINEGIVGNSTWIKHSDSDTSTMVGKIEEKTSLKDIENEGFSAIFLCRSNMWSPPHLDAEFNKVVSLIKRRFTSGVKMQHGTDKDRYVTYAYDLAIKDQEELLKRLGDGT
jgi:hypothetical protein